MGGCVLSLMGKYELFPTSQHCDTWSYFLTLCYPIAHRALSCSCADGFSGPHCEYTTDDMTVPVVPQSTKETTSHGLSKDWRITIVISVVGLVGATVWYIVFSPRGRCARQRPTKSASWEPENLAAGEESDSDASTRVRRNAGNGLSSVDII